MAECMSHVEALPWQILTRVYVSLSSIHIILTHLLSYSICLSLYTNSIYLPFSSTPIYLSIYLPTYLSVKVRREEGAWPDRPEPPLYSGLRIGVSTRVFKMHQMHAFIHSPLTHLSTHTPTHTLTCPL